MGDSYLFESTDASAPELIGTLGSLITVLDAVLVNGYGAKASLGWTKEFAGTNLAAYRNSVADGTGFFLHADGAWHAWGTRFTAFEQMTDINTGMFPIHEAGDSNYNILTHAYQNSPAVAWKIIGDNRGFWICTQPYLNMGSGSIGYAFWRIAYFGDYIPIQSNNFWPFCILCLEYHTIAAYSASNKVGDLSDGISSTKDSYRAARGRTLASGSVECGLTKAFLHTSGDYIGGLSSGNVVFSEDSDPVQYNNELYIHEAGGILGKLPGVLNTMNRRGIDGVPATSVTQLTKVYKTIDLGDAIEHYIPYSASNNTYPSWFTLISGKGFRDDYI